MLQEDIDYVTFNLTEGRCNWSLRTWICLKNIPMREYIAKLYNKNIYATSIRNFYVSYMWY